MAKPKHPTYRKPSEMSKRDTRVSVHVRLPKDLVEDLDQWAMGTGLNRTVIVECVLEDYQDWLQGRKRPKSLS